MDAEKVAALTEALGQLRATEQAVAEASSAERRKLSAQIRGMNKTVDALQENVLNSYSSDYVVCRDIGHTWQLRTQEVNGNVLNRQLACRRCTTERHETTNRYGEILHRKYVHPTDYLLSNGMSTRMQYTKAFWRGIQFMVAARTTTTAEPTE